MYVFIEKETQKAYVYETKTDIAAKIKCHRNTVTNKLHKKDQNGVVPNNFNTDKGTVYRVIDYTKRLRKGNKDSLDVKKAKAEGKIPKKSDKNP